MSVKRTHDNWDAKVIKELDTLFDTIKPGKFLDKQTAQTIFEQKIRAGNIEPEGFLADGSLNEEMFTTLLHPTYTVDSLPALPNGTYPEGQIVYLTSDGHFYYNRADTWIDGSDHASLANLTAGDPHTQYLKEADFDDIDFLVGTATGHTAAEIVVGTTPGGELGGTWASPTVDATHSGSTHSTATDAHIADTTDAHDASAVSLDPTGLVNVTATEVQGAVEELDAALAGGGIPSTLIDAKGDLIAGTAADTVDRLPVGANGEVLTADSGEATGLRWGSGSAGAPVDADYLVGTANAGLSNEIAVGTTPGGELGGTWASPTVDATHSGSSHAGVVSTHEAASDPHPGYLLESLADAAGDLLVASGADAWARLALGAAGGAVSRVNGVVAWNSGTSFPTAATGDRYWRTDLGMEFFYDGTRWLSTALYQQDIDVGSNTLTATTTVNHVVPMLHGGSDIWIEDIKTGFIVVGGTALSASHKWVATFAKIHALTATTIALVTIDSGSSDTYREIGPTAIDALLNNGTPEFLLRVVWTKTGTPGNLTRGVSYTYRVVAT